MTELSRRQLLQRRAWPGCCSGSGLAITAATPRATR